MTSQISSPPLGSSYPSLAPVLIGASLKGDIEQAARLSLAMTLYLLNVAARIDLPLVNETEPATIVPKVLLASLQAATQHAVLGHKSPTFRDCARPMCRDSANLIPDPMTLEPGAAAAELDAIFQLAMAALAIDAPEAVPLVVQERTGPLFEQFWDDLTQLRLS